MGLRNELWDRCMREGTPLLEEERALFVWFDETAPRLLGDFKDGEGQAALELEQVEDGVWMVRVAVTGICLYGILLPQ